MLCHWNKYYFSACFVKSKFQKKFGSRVSSVDLDIFASLLFINNMPEYDFVIIYYYRTTQKQDSKQFIFWIHEIVRISFLAATVKPFSAFEIVNSFN